jgi:hypothetical protein
LTGIGPSLVKRLHGWIVLPAEISMTVALPGMPILAVSVDQLFHYFVLANEMPGAVNCPDLTSN